MREPLASPCIPRKPPAKLPPCHMDCHMDNFAADPADRLTPMARAWTALATVGSGLAYMTVEMTAPPAGTIVCRMSVCASAMATTAQRRPLLLVALLLRAAAAAAASGCGRRGVGSGAAERCAAVRQRLRGSCCVCCACCLCCGCGCRCVGTRLKRALAQCARVASGRPPATGAAAGDSAEGSGRVRRSAGRARRQAVAARGGSGAVAIETRWWQRSDRA
eukprot:256096-Chlamydomonas_euryale.AAC.6